MLIGNFMTSLFNVAKYGFFSIFLYIDSVVYKIVSMLFSVFFSLAELQLLKDDAYQAISSRIYLLVGIVALFGDGRVHTVADGDQARRDQADATLCARKEILQHLVVGTAGFLGHLAVAHRRHDKAVFHLQPVDLDGGEELVVGIKLLRHTRRAAGAIAGIGLEPVTVAVDQLLYQCVSFHVGMFLAS